MADMVLNVAAKAVIVNDEGKVLIVRESQTDPDATNKGIWGVPGGRLDADEAFYDGLAREVFAETGLTVEALQPLHVGEWHPVVRGVTRQIIGVFMLCRITGGEIRLSEEHDEFAWVDQKTMHEYVMKNYDDEAVLRGLAQSERA